MTEPEVNTSPEGDSGQEHLDQPVVSTREKYWSGKFILTNVILLLLAAIAGYLEYVAYPALMTSPYPPSGYGFGETNVVLNLSFLTFQLSAVNSNCASSICPVKGIPAFDFCQALVYLVILINLVHFVRLRTRR
jgi:hypothetical protein